MLSIKDMMLSSLLTRVYKKFINFASVDSSGLSLKDYLFNCRPFIIRSFIGNIYLLFCVCLFLKPIIVVNYLKFFLKDQNLGFK